jgi:DNA-binding transcriptional LysR family regulator
MDLDLRLVRYFTVVAEHSHFGRAADELRVAQPSLSRQIRRLEQQLGARLFDRTPQGTRLTEAGAVFLSQAKDLLKAAGHAAARTRAAASPSRVTIGYTSGLIVTPAVRELRRQNPDADVKVVHLDIGEPRTALLDHKVDAVVTRSLFTSDQLNVTILYSQQRVVVLPVDHRLAGKEYVTLDDIADEPLPRIANSDPAWSAYWLLEPRPDGRPAPDGPVIEHMEDKFELVAAGESLAIAVDHGRPIRPDITTVPIDGVEPSHVVVATRANDKNRLVAAFRKYARDLITKPSN